MAAAGCRSLTYGLFRQRWNWLYSVEPVAAVLCHIERFVVLGATLVTGGPSGLSNDALPTEQILAQSKSLRLLKFRKKFASSSRTLTRLNLPASTSFFVSDWSEKSDPESAVMKSVPVLFG